MARFETETLTAKANLDQLIDLSGRWIDRVHRHRKLTRLVLDMDSSVSEAYTSTGEAVAKVRRRHHRNRKGLQGKGTKGAKRRLKKLAGREGRFCRHVNHCIPKAIVSRAKDTGRGSAVAELTGTGRGPSAARSTGCIGSARDGASG